MQRQTCQRDSERCLENVLTHSICIYPILYSKKVITRTLLFGARVHLRLRGVDTLRKGALSARVAVEDIVGACPLLEAVSKDILSNIKCVSDSTSRKTLNIIRGRGKC